ncbi:MAG: hypothetical protein KME60_03500 [Cyanomargarita calcarea GSE-NOS-MK-12-04C]|jgi:hypothetical protein|uniref:Uncharacterized protein n=1 Tax=Cyanomargarita calcarea GSE-NOS-MK-12-04C TaxID=2839659 RepID=A0A951URA3_9CYAN|nr:hypothetical protein [Cyanomargarita calcarea GSE-NOS-MK-12-04C]
MSTFLLATDVADSCRKQDAIATFCTKNLMDKTTFANLLGINRRTLGRWEGGIVNKIARLRYYYYSNGSITLPKKPPLLDGYRRLVLSAIAYRRMSQNKPLELILEEFKTFSTDVLSREAYETWANNYKQSEG